MLHAQRLRRSDIHPQLTKVLHGGRAARSARRSTMISQHCMDVPFHRGDNAFSLDVERDARRADRANRSVSFAVAIDAAEGGLLACAQPAIGAGREQQAMTARPVVRYSDALRSLPPRNAESVSPLINGAITPV
jgi:hypothetical protein